MKKNEFTDICVAFNGVPLGSPNRIEAERIRRFPDFHSNSPPLIRPRWKRAFVSSPSLLLNGRKKRKKMGPDSEEEGSPLRCCDWYLFHQEWRPKRNIARPRPPSLTAKMISCPWMDGQTDGTMDERMQRQRKKSTEKETKDKRAPETNHDNNSIVADLNYSSVQRRLWHCVEISICSLYFVAAVGTFHFLIISSHLNPLN